MEKANEVKPGKCPEVQQFRGIGDGEVDFLCLEISQVIKHTSKSN